MESTFADKASENLRAANLLFEQEMYNASANRAYYAALQAAVAALEKAGIRFDRINHETVQARFNTELIRRRKTCPGRFRSHLSDLQLARNVADYGSRNLSNKLAKRQLNRAEEFVEALQKEKRHVQ